MAGFIFGGNTGTSAEDLAKRRKVIDALRDRSTARMPRDVGEGIYALGTAIVGRAKDRKLDPLEDAERGRAGNAFEAITSQLTGYRPSTGAPMSAMPMAPRSESAAIGDDAMAAIGRPPNAGGYRESLIGTESGGNWGAQNNEVGAGGQAGHYGRVQFGRARLQDAMEAGAIPQGTTPEAFMASPELQMAAENWHFADLESELAPYVGTVVNGQPLDMGALVAMGHLGGAAGARRFVESGGQYNPSDAYGTSLADYARTHGGQGGGGGQSAGAGSTGVNPQIITQLAELAQNPYLPEGQKLIVQQLLGTQLAQMGPQDPMAALELERAQLEIEALRNPQAQQPEALIERQALAAQAGLEPGTPEYQAYILNGETAGGGQQPAAFAALDAQARAAGYEPGTPEYQEWMRNGGGSGAPAAFIALDLQAQAAGYAPGTPEYKEFMATRGAGEQAAARARGEVEGAQTVSDPAQIASADETLSYIQEIRDHPGFDAGTGMSSMFNVIPGTSGYDFQNRVKQLAGGAFLVAIDELQGMGALSNMEGQTATAAIARLDTATSPAEFMEALSDYEGIVKRGRERAASRVRVREGAPETDAPPSQGNTTPPPIAGAPPEGISPDEWQAMTPEEKALFQ